MSESKDESLLLSDQEVHDFECDVDPGRHVFNSRNSTCCYYSEEQFAEQIVIDSMFSLIHFNCRSLYKNFDKINDYLHTLKGRFMMIALSETWMQEERGVVFHIDGYELYHINRTNKRSGGVALFVNEDLKCKQIQGMTMAIDDIMECISVEIELEKMSNIIVTCIYRRPGSLMDTFIEKMDELLSKVNENKTFLVCGDFNIDLLKVTKQKSSADFLEIMYGRGLYPLIDKPSRITEQSVTLIDNIFINCFKENIKCGLVINDVSDHLPIFVTFSWQLKRSKEEIGCRLVRVRNDDAINRFRIDLLNEEWEGVYVEDVDAAYNAFLKRYIAYYDKHCPIVVHKQKVNENRKPWVSKGLMKACKKKNKLYRNFIKYRTNTAEMKYKVYKNKLVVIMRQAKKDYYNKLLNYNKNNLKGTWNILNKVMGNKTAHIALPDHFIYNNKTLHDLNEVANEFNSFFVNMGPNLADSIKIHDMSLQRGGRGDSRVLQSMFLGDVSESEIISIVSKSKSKTSIDCDGIDMIILKKTIDCVVKPLCYICNLSFASGIFPDRMKRAKVIPLFKAGNKQSFDNYRPVSLLSQFSKVLEKLFVYKLDSFLEKHHLLSESQYGFRQKRSTATALMNIVEEITTATDEKKFTVGVFIDLKKAFDTLNHDILLSKLSWYGMRGMALNWLRSYLHNRKQYVQLTDVKSELMEIKCGVPQGSILGPKLFLLYINDICDVSKLLQFVLFADDTNFFSSGNNIQKLVESIEYEMTKLKKWFDVNKLSLNLKKTKFMVFGNRKINESVALSIDGVDIERVFEFRFLGVIMDDKLSWKPHIAHIKRKICQNIFVLNKVKEVLNKETMKILYSSLIVPYFIYCIEVWGNTYQINIKPLSILQKRAIRIIHKVNYREHTSKLFAKSRILKLEDLVKFQTLIILFKARHKMLPEKIQHLYQLEKEFSRRRYNFKHQFARTTIKQMCPSVMGVKVWNSLHDNLKSCSNIGQFKYKYKQSIFSQY